MPYFSEREGRLVPRDKEQLSDAARDGVGALIRRRVGTDAFGQSFPVRCHRCKESQINNTDTASFWAALEGAVPALKGWPKRLHLDRRLREDPSTMPSVFDVIEFCWEFIAEPSRVDASHFADIFTVSILEYGRGEHIHLQFDRTAGRREFANDIEDIFRRNGMAYSLTDAGRVERILPAEFDAIVQKTEFRTGDAELDRLLDTARTKFLDPRLVVRRESLEALWDAWERLKTTWPGSRKDIQADAMLDKVAGDESPKLRKALGNEALELTSIGNNLRIRHAEKTQEILAASEHVDYLFQRLFSLIWMILRTQKMVGAET